MQRLVLTDDLQHRVALVRWRVESGDPVALTAAQVALAEAVVAAVDRRTATLARVRRPAPLRVGLPARSQRRRA